MKQLLTCFLLIAMCISSLGCSKMCDAQRNITAGTKVAEVVGAGVAPLMDISPKWGARSAKFGLMLGNSLAWLLVR